MLVSTVVPLLVLIKDRPLTALLSYWTHAPCLAGRISRSDREAWTLSGPGVEPPCAVLVMVEENDEGAARNLGYLGHRNGPRVLAVPVEAAIWS